jgi:hypothetical protein
MGSPEVKSVPLLRGVNGAVVNAGNAGSMARYMVENGLNNMRLNSEFRHTRRCCAAEIVKSPRAQFYAGRRYPFVQRRFGIAPTLKSTVTFPE